MNCERCQTPAPDSAAFCRECGAALPAPAVVTPTAGSSLAGDERALGARARACGECGAPLRAGAQFCASCGTAQAGAAAKPAAGLPPADRRTVSDAPPEPATAATPAATVTASAAATAATVAAKAQKLLIPSFPGRMVWNPRRTWRVSTRLSPREIAELFEGRMTQKANVLMRINSYFRHARWDVRRNAISEEIVATCKPTGIVTAGFGRSKIHVDVSGDTLVLQTARTGETQTNASVGPGVFTTWLGLYMYPASVYAYDVVKAIKRADRDAVVTYPWSYSRIAGLALILVGIVASMAGAGGSGSSQSLSSNDPGSDQSQFAPPPPPPAAAAADPDTDTTPPDDDDDSSESATGAFTSADGYVVSPPEGWIRDSDSTDKGTFTESRWHLARSPDVYVLVNRTAGYAGSAEDGATAVHASARQAADYEEFGWRELAPSGWYWEFHLAGQRKIDVFTKACGDGYAALGAAPAAQFETHRATIVAFIESLAPPCGDATPSISAASSASASAKSDKPDSDTTPTTTTGTETTPAAPTHTVSPEAARNSPSRILRRFWQRLSAGEYDVAYELLSSGYKGDHPNWKQDQAAAEPLANVTDIGPSTISGSVAKVEITLYARDRNSTGGSDTDCHRFNGQAKLVKEGSAWRYDRGANRFDDTVVDAASPECNP